MTVELRHPTSAGTLNVGGYLMATTFHVDIVSAEGEIFSGEAAMVFAPAVMGEIGIAPRHAPLLTTLKPGEVRVQLPTGEEQFFYVSGGAHRDPAASGDRAGGHGAACEGLDEAAALQAKQRAEEALQRSRRQRSRSPRRRPNWPRAVAQIKAIEKLRKLQQ